MSTGPWLKHAAHCPRCGTYARQWGAIGRYRCANTDCRKVFWVERKRKANGAGELC